MNRNSSSSHQPGFCKPNHFENRGNDWYCNICTPHSSRHIEYMSAQGALRHERSSPEHARNVAETEMWWNPPAAEAAVWDAPLIEDPPSTLEEFKLREHQMHVDHVQDMVPFWIRGVEAAEKGEVLKMEHFLETLQRASENSWFGVRGQENPWAYAASGGGWGGPGWDDAGRWGVESVSSANVSLMKRGSGTIDGSGSFGKKSPIHDRKRKAGRGAGRGRGRGKPRETRDTFVENFAREEALDRERRQKMESFYQMSTEDKVRKIDEVVRNCRVT